MIMIRLTFILALVFLPACAPKIALPKGIVCWPDQGYFVCQFLTEEQKAVKT